MTSLALLQLVSPALPVGAFSYSEGLEVLVQAGALKDEATLEQFPLFAFLQSLCFHFSLNLNFK